MFDTAMHTNVLMVVARPESSGLGRSKQALHSYQVKYRLLTMFMLSDEAPTQLWAQLDADLVQLVSCQLASCARAGNIYN